MKYLDTFKERLNENREKIFLNGWEYWLDREKQAIYDTATSEKGILYDTDGTSIWSSHLTKDEKRQLQDYIKYGKK